MRIEEADVQALHVAEDVAAKIEHDLLAHPLHEIDLDEFKEVREAERAQVQLGELRNAVPWVGREMLRQPGGGHAGLAAHVAVNADFDEERACHVAEGFERDRYGRYDCLDPVRLHVGAETPGKLRVVYLAYRLVVFARRRFGCGGLGIGDCWQSWLLRIFGGFVRHQAQGRSSLLYEAAEQEREEQASRMAGLHGAWIS